MGKLHMLKYITRSLNTIWSEGYFPLISFPYPHVIILLSDIKFSKVLGFLYFINQLLN